MNGLSISKNIPRGIQKLGNIKAVESTKGPKDLFFRGAALNLSQRQQRRIGSQKPREKRFIT